MDLEIRRKTAIVCAGSWLGRAVAAQLSHAGAKVYYIVMKAACAVRTLARAAREPSDSAQPRA